MVLIPRTSRPNLKYDPPADYSECIYNLAPQPDVKQEKPPRYKSIYNEEVKEKIRKSKAPHKTMGYAKTPLDPPKQFLKKHSKEPKSKETTAFKYPDEDRRRPAVPKHDERPVMPGEPTKNFISENKRDVIRAPPHKPPPKTVDTQHGDTLALEFSGLVPKYLNKKEYGEIPQYLKQRKADMEYSKAAYDNFVMEESSKGAPSRLTEEEKEEMLKGLRENWREVHHKYQGLSLITDTLRKKTRKEGLEAEMERLERDIRLLERHKDIYILPEPGTL